MSIQRVLDGERVNTPSRQSIKKRIGRSHTAKNFRVKPGYIYTVVRAISARVNQNYDGWPGEELRKAAHTFVGKPVFVNHENFDPSKARGVVVASRYIENGNDKYIEVIQEIDAHRFPKLAKEIQTGGLDSVSMGAEAGFTICSACGNRAEDVPDMCDHVLYHKGEHVRVPNRKTGKFEDKLVYESCHKLSFFELSYVFDPADETAVASKVIVAGRKTGGGESTCPPGQNCETPAMAESMGGGQMGPDNNHTTGGGGGGELGGTVDSSGGTQADGSSASSGNGGLTDQAAAFKDMLSTDYAGADIGGYNPTVDQSWDEHATGGALDFMSGDPEQAAEIRQKAFDNGAEYVLFNQTQWNPDGTSSPMDDRGSPTENHMDHSHIKFPTARKAMVRRAVMRKLANSADDYFEWKKKVDSGEIIPEKGPRMNMPNKSLQDWAAWSRKRTGSEQEHEEKQELPPGVNSQRTQRPGTMGTYRHVHQYFNDAGAPTDGVLDYGAGLGHSSEFGHTYEPYPRDGFKPTYDQAGDVPAGAHGRVTNLNVLNVVPPGVRHQIVDGIGASMAPGGHAVITTRGKDVYDAVNQTPAKGDDGPLGPGVIINKGRRDETYQKGFHPDELHQYVSDRLGPGYTVNKVNIGSAPAAVHIIKNPEGHQASLKERVAMAVHRRLAYGETEAPPMVDTLRQEGTAPEDDNDDFHRYVDPPDELSDPDLSAAGRIDRQQEEDGTAQDDGVPGAADPRPEQQGGQPMPPEDDPTQYMTLKIPIPQPPQAEQPPAQPFIQASVLDYLDDYLGYRVANWQDAIVAGRECTPEELGDFYRESARMTLEKTSSGSRTSRNLMKGTAIMARSTLAARGSNVATGRRKHFAEGPLTDGGDVSRNDQGEQEEAFITETPGFDPVEAPTDDTRNISNTEGNLVADAEYARSLTSKMEKQRIALEATAREYSRLAGLRSANGNAGGPTPSKVNPSVQDSESNALLGDHFESADPDEGATRTDPGAKESSLQAFRTFDRWLTATTGRHAKDHSERNIKTAARQFAAYNKVSVQTLFPALGIVLRDARKNEAAAKTRGANMRKRAVDLETAAPDERISVPTPVKDTTDAEAQASQFDTKGFADNAGDSLADPDLSTGHNFAPGEAPKTSAKRADGILAIRCAEAMIAAGLEENTRERKYALAREFESMSRGLILDRTALAERFAMVRHADRNQRVASGNTRGTTSPVPPGMTRGGSSAPRTASQRVAANDPTNDSLLFG